MKLLKRLMHGYHLARYLLILCAIGSLWWEGESVWGAGVLAILMVGIPLWKLLQRTTRTRQTVDVISGGIRVESAAGVSEEISAWEVGGLRVIRSGLLIYGICLRLASPLTAALTPVLSREMWTRMAP